MRLVLCDICNDTVDDDKLHSSMTIYNHNNAKSMDLCGHCTGDLVLRRFKKEIEAV